MISKPSIFSSLAIMPLSVLAQPRFVFSLLALSLCGGFSALALPRLMPRALSMLWGPLPPYELQLHGGDLCLRCTPPADDPDRRVALAEPRPSVRPALTGVPQSALTLRPPRLPAAPTPSAAVRLDAPLAIRLRPTAEVTGPVFAHAFLRHDDRTAAWPVILEHAADGTLQLRGIVRDLLDLTPQGLGRYELLFVLQRSPLPPPAAVTEVGPSDPAAQLLRGELTVLPPVDELDL